jgi:hypothetical protein
MGEIATWSAVKTKVGLGKDSNECPTKAELLALSPTGTGENYVGLEISNASSYGNNETVQLSDIHKVTYKYSFAAVNTSLNFPALGGKPTPEFISIGSTRQKYLDGVASGSPEDISYNISSTVPDWLNVNNGTWTATENTSLSQRSTNVTFTQGLSGKTLTVSMVQAAGVETWEYNFSVEKTSLSFSALGGVSTTGDGYINILSNKQRYINGKVSGSPVTVTYSSNDFPDWLSYQTEPNDSVKAVATENKSESSRSFTRTVTQAESGKKVTITYNQVAGVKTYGTPTVYLGSIADIPASGGTAATPTYTYSQLWGWNGKTNDGGTISSGASVVWSENISGSNLGTTAKARTKLGSRTLTVTLNGKSGSASIDVYQAENKIESVTQGGWIVSISANPSTFTEQGGTSQISASARASRTNHWTSGATSAASDATGTPTLSIPTAVTGFSLSGTTLTVAENTTANQRSVVIRATMDTIYKEVTVTQSSYLVEWKYYLTTSTPTLNFDAIGATKSGTISSYREKYINGSLVEGSHEGVNIQVKSTSAEIQSATTAVAITMKENTTTQARTGTVVYEQVGSGKTVTITCNQVAGTISTREVLSLVSPFASPVNALGGSDVATVKSGYYDVVNGKDTTWHNSPPSVSSKSNYIIRVDITKGSGDVYEIEAHLSENTTTTSRTGNIGLIYGSKSLSMSVSQSAASVVYSYDIKWISSSVFFGAGANAEAILTFRCNRTRLVNGTPTTTEAMTPGLGALPSWLSVKSWGSGSVTLVSKENTSTTQRSGTVTLIALDEPGASGIEDSITVTQDSANVEWDYHFSIYSPSSKRLNVVAKPIDPDTIVVSSYRTLIVNGLQTSTVEFVDVTIDPIEESWLEVTKNSNDQTQAELFVTCLENKVSSIRSATVTIRQVGTSQLDQVDINQSAATVSYNYYIGFNGNPDVGGYSMNWEYTQFGSSHGQSIDLKCWRKPVINGIESDTEEAAEYEAIFSGVGIDSFTVTNTPLSYDPTITTVRAYPKSTNGSVFDLKGTVQYRIADYPSKSAYLYLTHKPVATVKRWTFQWYDQVESVTMKNVSHDSSAGSISPITIISKCEYLLASNQSQIAYTEYIKPTVDEDTASPVSWGRLLENGQTAQNYYDYAYLVDENKEDYDRQATKTFTQPGNPSNKRLYLYVTQEKKIDDISLEAYLYNTYNANNNIQVRISWQGSSKEDGSVGDNLVISKGGYLGAYTGLNEGNLYVQFKGKPGAGSNSSMYISLQNLHLESGNEYEGTLEKTPLTIGPSSGSYNIEWGSFSINNEAFTCRIADYGLNTEGGFIYFVVEKTNTNVQVLEGAQIGSIPLHLKSNVEGFDGMFGTINIDFFYGMP